MAHPEWLSVPDRTVVVLGAGAEMGPLQALLRWGARVAAIDLPNREIWQRVTASARDRAGTMLVPAPADSAGADGSPVSDRAGLNLLSDLAAAAQWIRALDGELVLGNYVYADGVT